MTLQDVVWTIWLVGAALIAVGFIFVIVQAGKPADDAAARDITHRAHVLQGTLFGILFGGFALGSWATLIQFPIPPQHGKLDAQQVVDVVGRQWSWQLTPGTVKAGSVVEFRVTSADVNHDFALYAPDGRIVAQVQAMPGYTNKLLHTFAQPGTYTVQCLEYCGLAHASMRTTLKVVGVNAVAATAASETPAPTVTPTQTAAATAPAVPDGEQLFRDNCAACHQANGQGIAGVFPSLHGNTVVNDADPTKHIHVVLYGLHGELVDGKKYSGVMTPFKDILSDDEIAAVINHERSSWGNHGTPITADQVAALRKAGK